MADRGASSAFKTEIAQSNNRPFHLLRVILYDAIVESDVTYRLTDYVAELSWDDGSGGGPHTWEATGRLLGFGDIEETSMLGVRYLDISLSGVDQSLIGVFLGGDGSSHSYQFINRSVSLWKGLLADDGSIVSSPILIYRGKIDTCSFDTDSASGTSTITARVASDWADFRRRWGRHTNDAEQQAWFPGDRGMEYVQDISSRSIQWGFGSKLLPKDH